MAGFILPSSMVIPSIGRIVDNRRTFFFPEDFGFVVYEKSAISFVSFQWHVVLKGARFFTNDLSFSSSGIPILFPRVPTVVMWRSRSQLVRAMLVYSRSAVRHLTWRSTLSCFFFNEVMEIVLCCVYVVGTITSVRFSSIGAGIVCIGEASIVQGFPQPYVVRWLILSEVDLMAHGIKCFIDCNILTGKQGEVAIEKIPEVACSSKAVVGPEGFSLLWGVETEMGEEELESLVGHGSSENIMTCIAE